MKSFIEMLFSNKKVLEARKFNIFIITLIFLINISLISVPNFIGKMESIETIGNLEGIGDAFEEMYDYGLDCKVESLQMSCNVTEDLSFNGYKFIYSETMELEGIDESVIYFSKDHIAIIYVVNDRAVDISGDYSLLEGQDFSTVSMDNTEGLSLEEYYMKTTDSILSAIYYSNLEEHMALIYIGQLLQNIIYITVVSLLFMLMNFKAKSKKVTVKNSFKIVVTSMTGPAFLAAGVGLFFPALGSILFFIIYAIRAMLVYYKMNFSNQTYID